jgi:predicted nucleotidyltransferase
MFDRVLKKIAEAFDSAAISYMIIGGQAVLQYGEPRFTRDIDITVGLGPHEAQPVLDLISRLGWQILVDQPEEFLRQTFVLPVLDPQSEIRIDFVFSQTEYERQALKRAVDVYLDEVRLRFASLEDLIVMKTIAGRPRDLEDARKILQKNPRFNRRFVEETLQKYDQELDTHFVQTFRQLSDFDRGAP